MRRKTGFTLVELLVVIGIIALLISILLPSLSRARSAAKRTMCLSNLRSVAQMQIFYSLDHKDQVPLGTLSDVYQQSYVIAVGSNDPARVHWPVWGPLYRAGFMETPEIMYCPSENRSYHQFDAEPDNRWKPENPADDLRPWNWLRAGYLLRPMDGNYKPVLYRSNPPFTPVDNKNTPVHEWSPFPKLVNLRRSALAADIFINPVRVTQRHEEGFNTAYTDGSAIWIERKRLTYDLPESIDLYGNPAWKRTIPPNAFESLGTNDSTSNARNPLMQAIWQMLDQD